MYIKIFLALFFSLLSVSSYCQFDEDFSDGELTSNPTWQGDLQDFIINDNNELQLFAEEAGESFLFTDISLGSPQLWEIYLRMDFSPSSSNFCRIYLGLDSPELSSASGYYLEFGQSGSEDAIELYQLDKGAKSLISTGSIASIANDPAQARIQFSYTNDNTINCKADFNGSNNYLEEFTETLVLDLSTLKYFGIYTKYTSTRVDKFFFDDISIPDFSAPSLSDLEVLDQNTILLCFNEDLTNAEIDQFSISPELNIASLTFDPLNAKKVELQLSDPIVSGIEYVLNIHSIQDLIGNIADDINQSFIFVSEASINDLKVSEILFDPLMGGEDFVEIYNSSDQVLSLENIQLANLDKEEVVNIQAPSFIAPGQYLAFTSNKDFLNDQYNLLEPQNVFEQAIPSFNNADGNFSVLLVGENQTTTIDSFDYQEDYHFVLLNDTEGVSLERISYEESSQNIDNWHSASVASGNATPGYENSNFTDLIAPQSMFELQNKTFSPNGDSDNDLLILNYQSTKPGFIVDINIFDASGRPVKNLARSLFLSARGFIQWDGINEEGERERIGVYILNISGFHPDGDKVNERLLFTLADFLD